uniref:Aminoglycoside phosphotransferase family protein n=1 Tax=Roseihalotalea indica TaxID=2867963 RepID=A0AA49JGW4_9BACT|nr:aminoglycoside phosphotransferase family protein [Tunicatimonas sp. TK19036]
MSATNSYPIAKIIQAFDLEEKEFSLAPFGSGHINDTFLVDGDGDQRYLLQRINHEVFKDVDGLMHNMAKVTAHLRRSLDREGNANFTTVQLIPTRKGDLYHQDDEGRYWRVQTFISNSTSYDLVTTDEQAFQAGAAFGYFQKLLRDMPADGLKETIPNFHNMESRFEKFHRVLDADPEGKKVLTSNEIDFALQRQEAMLGWHQLVKDQVLPLRITHNDTKFNNVLLERRTQKAICVIDLDTVMPGVVGYDFGDAIRTIVNTVEEDETDLTKIEVNLSFYEAFAKGFFKEIGDFLTEAEIRHLPFAAHYMTFIMGLRFLTDYLEGNVYYKVRHPLHNIQRARAQFALVAQLEKYSSQTEEIMRRLSKER